MREHRLEVADVFHAHQQEFLERWGHVVSRQQRKVLGAIGRCRTVALGSHLERCDSCSYEYVAFDSCRDRHYPKCQSTARDRWLQKQASSLLPVPYSHVVFTLPKQLAALALRNQRLIYALLGDSTKQLDVVLTGFVSLNAVIGRAAVAACEELSVDPRERIRTYAYGVARGNTDGFGMVLEPLEKRYQEVRTFLIQECDAIVAIVGGKGTADSLQKAMLAHKPVFPIPVAGGASAIEWERLRRMQYCNRTKGDLDFLADRSLSPQALADMVARHCVGLFQSQPSRYSRRIFLVHGHDTSLKSEIARFLERLDLEPLILHEQPDKGATIFAKLQAELADVGYAFVLMTPDDKGCQTNEKKPRPRARQNVVFEHGLLVGMFGASRVCAIVKGAVELPSDLQGIVYKQIPAGGSVDAIAIELMRELVSAGYRIDTQTILGEGQNRPL